MSTALRCWIAGGGLLASWLVLGSRGSLGDLAGWGPAALLVVLLNAWIIAVGERGSAPRGLRTPRFPLARRLAGVEPTLLGMGLLVLALILLCTRSWVVTAWIALIFAVLGVEPLRRAAWFLVPAAAVVHGLVTMPEFHTLGDLLHELNAGLAALAWTIAQAVIACGPLLRTDAGALGWFGRWVAALAALPGYVAAAWLAGHVPQAAELPPSVLLLVVVLVGGVAQSVLLGLMSWAVAVRVRPAHLASPASPYRVGMALLPLFLPVVLAAALPLAPWPAGTFAGAREAAPEVWTAMLLVLVAIPAVPAAALVGAALDRVDRRRFAGFSACLAAGALLAWAAAGPQLLPRLLGADGPVDRLAALCGLGARENVLTAALTPPRVDGPPDLVMLGLSAGRFCQAVTGMVAAAALLAALRVRHARPGGRFFGWLGPAFLLVSAGAGAWTLAPRMGPLGMVLGAGGACVLMIAVDLVRGAAPALTVDDPEASTLVPDQRDRRRTGGSVAGGRRASDEPAPETPADEPAPAPKVREAIT